MSAQPVNIVIGDRSFRLKIQPQDEEQVRRTLKLINDKILEFKGLFAGKDMQDYISMVLIWFATEQSRAAGQLMQWEALKEALDSMSEAAEKTTLPPAPAGPPPLRGERG